MKRDVNFYTTITFRCETSKLSQSYCSNSFFHWFFCS